MNRVLMLGIDSMDSILLSRFAHKLPNLRELKGRSPKIVLKSVYPPDSETAWASIYTGLNPAKHGMLHFVDPLDKINSTISEIDNSTLQGKTFWDFAGKMGRKVCILFPHIGYPPWQVNGIMFARTNEKDVKKFPIQAYPPSFARDFELSDLNSIKGVPARRLFGEYIEACRKLVQGEIEFGLKMLTKEKWDLFFIYSSTLDWIQHNMWMYFDENDPTYPGPNIYQNVIEEFYLLYDEFIGKFIAAADSNTTVLVISDHGHGMRPTTLVNINEILRNKGLLVPKIKRASFRDQYFVLEMLKGKAVNFINRHTGMAGIATWLMKLIPAIRRSYTTPTSIDWDKTIAYVSDLSGIKAYTYGGIIIKRERLENAVYEEIRSRIIDELSQIKEPNTGEWLMKWICRREELYSGEYIFKYPDIVFEFRDGYGAGWAVYDSLIVPCRTHNIQPGSHRVDTPVFFMLNRGDKECSKENVTLMDVAPTVLDILGIEGEFGFDGESLMREKRGK